MYDPFSDFGNSIQASTLDAKLKSYYYEVGYPLRMGVIYAVRTKDDSKNRFGFTVYDVMIMPDSAILRDVPSFNNSGHYNNSSYGGGDLTKQNSEETPLVAGQPVVVGFIENNNVNPFIICTAAVQDYSNSELASEHPKKSGKFQGTSWSIDKNGATVLDIKDAQTLTVKVNGVLLCKVTGTTVEIGNGGEFGVLGNTLQTFLNSFIITYNAHTHTETGTITTIPIVQAGAPPTVTTTILKVQ